MAQVILKNVKKAYGDVIAVENADVTFKEGSFTTLLGPSGCGKTTILRMVAGLTTPTSGDILIGDRLVNEIPIHKRNLGLVFQNYALFPHKTVGENIAFGLKYRDVAKADVATKVKEALDIVRLPGVEDRYPTQLSGGQQQRIAIARAIVIEPDVLLLDEPLSALDANLREDMRVELKAIQHRIGVTTIFVTHDQSEALAMSDHIIIMRAGRVEQQGGPEEVYNTPASEFVAQFLGASNIFDARVADVNAKFATMQTALFGRIDIPREHSGGLEKGQSVKLMVRAEKLKLAIRGNSPKGSATTDCAIGAVDYQGQVARYFVHAGEDQLQVIDMIEKHPFAVDSEVTAYFRPADCAVLPAEA